MGLFSKKKPIQTYVAEPAPQPSAPVPPPRPAFEDPEDATRWEMVYSTHSSLAAMMLKQGECCEKAEMTEKAYAMGDAEFVDGIRQHEISRKHFQDLGARSEGELQVLLVELQQASAAAREQWQSLLFLLPAGDNDIMRIADWCMSHDVDTEIMSELLSNSMFINADFGTTRQSFWEQNDRIVAIMNQANQ